MREAIAADIRKHREAEALRFKRNQIGDQLLAAHEFEVPETLVEEELGKSLNNYARYLASQGVNLEKAEIDWRKMGEEFRPEAVKRVKRVADPRGDRQEGRRSTSATSKSTPRSAAPPASRTATSPTSSTTSSTKAATKRCAPRWRRSGRWSWCCAKRAHSRRESARAVAVGSGHRPTGVRLASPLPTADCRPPTGSAGNEHTLQLTAPRRFNQWC